jgi:polysaccharide biosynthesis/export protein PslD
MRVNSLMYSIAPFSMLLMLIGGLNAGCSSSKPRLQQEWLSADALSASGAPPILHEYHIQTGDVLDIKFFSHPEFNEQVTVRPDGKISLPLIGEITVFGLTPAAIDALLTEQYQRQLRQPIITVIVREFAGRQVFVGGEVTTPGLVTLSRPTTALQAIISVGGFRETARTDQIILIRKGVDNRPVGRTLDLARMIREGRDSQDVQLLPYDIVYVPRSTIAKMNLFVEQYIRRMLPVTPGFGFSVP